MRPWTSALTRHGLAAVGELEAGRVNAASEASQAARSTSPGPRRRSAKPAVLTTGRPDGAERVTWSFSIGALQRACLADRPDDQRCARRTKRSPGHTLGSR